MRAPYLAEVERGDRALAADGAATYVQAGMQGAEVQPTPPKGLEVNRAIEAVSSNRALLLMGNQTHCKRRSSCAKNAIDSTPRCTLIDLVRRYGSWAGGVRIAVPGLGSERGTGHGETKHRVD